MLMAHLLKEKYKGTDTNVIYTFANTGQEHEETLLFVERCSDYFEIDIVWLECVTTPGQRIGARAKIVDFKTASRDGEPFEAMIAKHGIPNVSTQHCTRELKERTILSFLKSIGLTKPSQYKIAIGIRADEPKRLKWDKVKNGNIIYPLATDFPSTRFDVNHFWSKQPFDLEIKSYEGNCKTCWKKSLRKLMTISKENPEWFKFFEDMESKYGMYTPLSRMHNPDIKPPHRFFRENRSVADIFEEAGFDFQPAIDESKDFDASKMIWQQDLDENDGCVQSCEPFIN